MTQFLSELKAIDVSEGTDKAGSSWELIEPFSVYTETLKAIVTVPSGFRCDGESIPSILRWLVPPFGQTKRGAFAHDYLYRLGGYKATNGNFVQVTRKQADDVYLELVKAKGAPTWRASMRYRVLRLVGWIAWNESVRNRP